MANITFAMTLTAFNVMFFFCLKLASIIDASARDSIVSAPIILHQRRLWKQVRKWISTSCSLCFFYGIGKASQIMLNNLSSSPFSAIQLFVPSIAISLTRLHFVCKLNCELRGSELQSEKKSGCRRLIAIYVFIILPFDCCAVQS